MNLKSGGIAVLPADPLLRRHGSLDIEWLRRFPEIVRLSPQRPDVIFLQEAKWFDHYGDELLHYVERRLRREQLGVYRGFLTRSHRSHHHQAIFIDTTRLEPVHHWTGQDPDEPRGLYGFLEVIVDGDERRTLWLKSVHLDPRDGDVRLAEAKQIHAAAAHAKPSDQRVMIAGDLNSITSRRTAEHGEPQRRFALMPVAKRYGKGVWPATLSGGETAPDTRALDYLIDCGWVCQAINDGNTTPTTLPGIDRGGELIIDRGLTYGALVTAPNTVWVDESNIPYSDHRALGGRIVISDEFPDHAEGESWACP